MKSKSDQFLILVQTYYLAQAIQKSGSHNISGLTLMVMMDDAIYASDRIPENYTAMEAATKWVEKFNPLPLENPDVPLEPWMARH